MDGVESDPVTSGAAASAADAWLRAVTSGDHRSAWSLIDPELRFAFAQAWIVQTLGRTRDDALAARLISDASTDPVWTACVRSNGEIWRTAHRWWGICGWQARPEPQPRGSFVRVTMALNPVSEVESNADGDEPPLQHFVMRRRDAWRIVGIGEALTAETWLPAP